MSGRERLTAVRREALLRELAEHRDVPVVLIVGGAGYGKSTLLDQWCDEETRPVVRIRLRPRHDDGTAASTPSGPTSRSNCLPACAEETCWGFAPQTSKRMVYTFSPARRPGLRESE